MKKLLLIAAALVLTACGSTTATPSANQTSTPPSNTSPGNQYIAAPPTASSHAFQGTLTATTASGTGDLDCRDFTSQLEAQIYFDSKGGSSTNNIDALDWNHNGIPCEVNENWAMRSKRWDIPTTSPVVIATPTQPSTGMCYVSGYTTKKGTHVAGYYRRC